MNAQQSTAARLLGVDVGQVFTIEGDDMAYIMKENGPHFAPPCVWGRVSMDIFLDMYENKDKIVLVRQWTENEKEAAKWLSAAGGCVIDRISCCGNVYLDFIDGSNVEINNLFPSLKDGESVRLEDIADGK